MQRITGELLSIDESTRTLTVLTKHGSQMSFRLSGRAAAGMRNLRVGQRVTVNFSLDLVNAGGLEATGLGFQPI